MSIIDILSQNPPKAISKELLNSIYNRHEYEIQLTVFTINKIIFWS